MAYSLSAQRSELSNLAHRLVPSRAGSLQVLLVRVVGRMRRVYAEQVRIHNDQKAFPLTKHSIVLYFTVSSSPRDGVMGARCARALLALSCLPQALPRTRPLLGHWETRDAQFLILTHQLGHWETRDAQFLILKHQR